MRNNTVVIIISFLFIFCRHGISIQVGELSAEITISMENRVGAEERRMGNYLSKTGVMY